MTYNINDKVIIYGRVVQKTETEEGISYEVVLDEPKRSYRTLTVKEKDLHFVQRG